MWAGVDFYDRIFVFDNLALDTVFTDPYGNIAFIDESGQQTIIPEIPAILKDAPEKAVIIEDKNGDQWVVQKERDGYKTTKVEGGGLQSGANVVISGEATDIIKKALRTLRNEYDDQKVEDISGELASRRTALDIVIKENNNKFNTGQTDVSTVPASTNESLFYDFVEVEMRSEDTSDEFSTRSAAVKEKELELNRALLIKYIASDLDRKDDYKLIARELRINGALISDFVLDETGKGTTEDVMVETVRQEIVRFIDQVFINYSNGN